MIRNLKIAFLMMTLLAGFAGPSFAADEFGGRFGNTSPAALGETPQDEEMFGPAPLQLQNIAPAAGEEEPAVTETSAEAGASAAESAAGETQAAPGSDGERETEAP
jgi:hypothetical protein